MVSWDALVALFGRSHALMLLERYVARYGEVVEKKLDFVVMAGAQDEFEHLSEVFEQDLRINETTSVAQYCRDEGYRSVLKSAVWQLLPKDDVLAVKALMVSDAEKARAAGWG